MLLNPCRVRPGSFCLLVLDLIELSLPMKVPQFPIIYKMSKCQLGFQTGHKFSTENLSILKALSTLLKTFGEFICSHSLICRSLNNNGGISCFMVLSIQPTTLQQLQFFSLLHLNMHIFC